MDLTTSYPHSVKDKLAGVVMIARTTDKAKATAHGNVGDDRYNCPMDQGVFKFLGIDNEQFLDTVKNAKSDADIEAYIRSFTDKKTPSEIEGFNREFLNYSPAQGSDSETYFNELRASVAPDRTDVTTWPDLLDLDEKREVPRRAVHA